MASANLKSATYAATGTQVPVSIDWRDDVPGAITAQVIFNAGASGSSTIEYTLDNASDPSVTPVWTTLGAALAASGALVIGFPVQFIRLNVASLAGGTLTFKVLQGNILGESGTAGGGSSSVTLAGPLGQAPMASSLPITLASNQTTIPVSLYPTGATPLVAGSANVANAAAVATLTPGATATAYISGFEVTGSGATAGLPVAVTVTGLLGGTRTYIYTFAVGALLGNTPLIVQFNPPLPADAVNTPIVVNCPAGGTGAANNTVVAHGYQV